MSLQPFIISLKIPFTDFSYAYYYGDSYLEFQGLHFNILNFIHLEFKTHDPHGLLLYIDQSPETIGRFLIQLFIRHGTLQVRHQNILLKEMEVKFGIYSKILIYIYISFSFLLQKIICAIEVLEILQCFKENNCQTFHVVGQNHV